jgi:hypothetical protein
VTATVFRTAGCPLAAAASGLRKREFSGRGCRMGFPEAWTGDGEGRCRGARVRGSTSGRRARSMERGSPLQRPPHGTPGILRGPFRAPPIPRVADWQPGFLCFALGVISFGSRSYVSKKYAKLDAWRECGGTFARAGTLDQRWRIKVISARRIDVATRHPVVLVREEDRGGQDATLDTPAWSNVLPRFGLTHRESQVYRKLEVSGQVELITSMPSLLSALN